MNVIAGRAVRLAGVLLLLAAAALSAAPAGLATPPQIIAATQTGGHVQVSWRLPPDGSGSFRVQVASKPQIGGDGEFFSENVVADDFLSGRQTSWTAVDPLPAGFYYVHVADSNSTCSTNNDCFAEQWSALAVVSIPLSAGFAWWTNRNGKALKNRAVAGGTLTLAVWNIDGGLPPQTLGICTSNLSILLQTINRIHDQTWVCAYQLPTRLAGKQISISLDVIFGTTGAHLHQTVKTTVKRR